MPWHFWLPDIPQHMCTGWLPIMWLMYLIISILKTGTSNPLKTHSHSKYKLDENYVGSLFFDKIISTGHKSLDEWATASQTTALIVIRKDTILYEKYFNGFGRESYFHSQSMAKSFISLLIGFAIEDGYINNIDEPITNYIPELGKRDIKFKQITIRNLLMMQSGLKYNTSFLPILNIHAPWHDEAVGYYHENVRQLLLDKVKISGEPGKKFQYCNYNTSYLGLVIERATGKTASGYLEEKLWSQVMGYEAMFSVDSKKSGFEYMPSRLIARAIDYARFGRLFLNNGNWDGKQLFPETWARESTLEDKSVPPGQYPFILAKWLQASCTTNTNGGAIQTVTQPTSFLLQATLGNPFILSPTRIWS